MLNSLVAAATKLAFDWLAYLRDILERLDSHA